MTRLGLETDVVDRDVYARSIERFAEAGIRLPTFSELADPTTIPDEIVTALEDVDPDAPHPLNLFRVHWHNGRDRRSRVAVPAHVVLTEELTGVPSPIIVALGTFFPMIRAHKVLAAYGCLAPRLVTGQFEPQTHRAIWPSTGNYCRGGVAISRIMQCHGVAVLPEGMSQERFDWLDQWALSPDDIIRTPGSESNVKEIYDECNRLDQEPTNIIFNQFAEFGNHLVHRMVTGPALERCFDAARAANPALSCAAFVSATGSAGSIAAGDHLKDELGARIVAVEALECPTLLYNGYGEHNIQGIGDKHVPYIHHTNNTDFVVGVSDRATDRLGLLFDSEDGLSFLGSRRGVPTETLDQLKHLGFSSIANVLAAIKVSKYLGLGADQAILTVATDGADLYQSENHKARQRYAGGKDLDAVGAAEICGEHLLGAATDHLIECTRVDRERMFNLGYFTWVEQQGVSLEDFDARRRPSFWRELKEFVPAWDDQIRAFNKETGA